MRELSWCIDCCEVVSLQEIYPKLAGLGNLLMREQHKERIFIRADKNTTYGDFMGVMNGLQDNGFYSVALIGEDNSK